MPYASFYTRPKIPVTLKVKRGGDIARSKERTYEQAEAAQDKAVRFLLDVVGDEEKAAEIEDLSVSEYAERKNFIITNPSSRLGSTLVDTRGARVTRIALPLEPKSKTGSKRKMATNAELEKAEEATEAAEETLHGVWDSILESDELENPSVEQLEEILANIATALNDYDSETFPMADDEAEEAA